MRSEPDFRRELRAWVREKAAGRGAEAVTDHTPLFARRCLRSAHLPELLLLLERLRGAPIDLDRLAPGDFRDIDTMVRLFATTEVQ